MNAAICLLLIWFEVASWLNRTEIVALLRVVIVESASIFGLGFLIFQMVVPLKMGLTATFKWNA